MNGGMVAGVVDQATSIAMRRDLAENKQGGLHREDIAAAVDRIEEENRDLNHTDELAEFVSGFRDEVVDIKRPQPTAAQEGVS